MTTIKSLILHSTEPIIYDEKIEYGCILERVDNDVSVSKDTLYFKIPKNIKHLPMNSMDSYVIATIMMAMHEKRDLHINGQVSYLLLSNLTEFMNVWLKWKPDEYSKINLKPQKVNYITTNNNINYSKAISAFSGGVDASFTIWSNYNKLSDFRSKNIILSLFVHGFDIPLNDAKTFSLAFKKAFETLNPLGIELIPVETNFREVCTLNWEDTHCTGLAACLHFFSHYTQVGLIGSSSSYDNLYLPWGSTPVTDHLLSSEQFFITHDGSGYTRSEKVKIISEWTPALKNLRVCWQGKDKSKNCCSCEKCIRTKLNFLSSNCDIPPSLGSEFKNSEFLKIQYYINRHIFEYEEIYKVAKQNGINDKWVFYLSIILFLHKTPYYRILRKLRKILKIK